MSFLNDCLDSTVGPYPTTPRRLEGRGSPRTVGDGVRVKPEGAGGRSVGSVGEGSTWTQYRSRVRGVWRGPVPGSSERGVG